MTMWFWDSHRTETKLRIPLSFLEDKCHTEWVSPSPPPNPGSHSQVPDPKVLMGLK